MNWWGGNGGRGWMGSGFVRDFHSATLREKIGKSAVSGLQTCKFCSYGIYIDPKTLSQQNDQIKKPYKKMRKRKSCLMCLDGSF